MEYFRIQGDQRGKNEAYEYRNHSKETDLCRPIHGYTCNYDVRNITFDITGLIGEKIAILLSVLSSQKIKDTASEMRIVKRSLLTKIFPLPDRLHFTPAMNARAVLSDDAIIKEKGSIIMKEQAILS